MLCRRNHGGLISFESSTEVEISEEGKGAHTILFSPCIFGAGDLRSHFHLQSCSFLYQTTSTPLSHAFHKHSETFLLFIAAIHDRSTSTT